MTDRPILFTGAMVRAVLDGTKTQTRRIVKPQPPSTDRIRLLSGTDYSIAPVPRAAGLWHVNGPVWAVRQDMGERVPEWRCPYGEPGDRLWVRETHAWMDGFYGSPLEDPCHVGYRADREVRYFDASPGSVVLDSEGLNWEHESVRWRPSIFLPRWASRTTLDVTDVRVEQVQDIGEEDAKAEGVARHDGSTRIGTTHRAEFACLWDSINSKRAPWSSNPWVWVVTFRRAP